MVGGQHGIRALEGPNCRQSTSVRAFLRALHPQTVVHRRSQSPDAQ
jgi:hypothetical protein